MAELNSGLDPGDETRRHGDYVGVPHGESDGTAIGSISGPVEGEAVAIDGSGNVAQADSNGAGQAIGVLYTYQYYGDSSNAGPYVDGDRDATVKTQGTVKAAVASGVSAGDHLATPDTSATGTAGVFDTANADGSSNFVALTDEDGNGYAEVLIR